MSPTEILTLVGSLTPIGAAVSYVAIRWVVRPLELKLDTVVRPLELRLETHIAEDEAIKPIIQASLVRLEKKVDQLGDRMYTIMECVRYSGQSPREGERPDGQH